VPAIRIGCRFDNRAAIRPVHIQPEGVQAERHHHRRGAQANDAAVPLHSERDALGQRIHADRVGRRFVERSAPADLHAYHVVPDEVDPQLLGMQPGQ
jgi:hypothetical protein